MAERRRYTQKDPDTQRPKNPYYTQDEIHSLIGGSRSKTAQKQLRADRRALAKVGLVTIEEKKITFATSIDQIRIDDLTPFWDFFKNIPNTRRYLTLPRRTCRALAGGFQTSVMATMIALMIRSLYWHKNCPVELERAVGGGGEINSTEEGEGGFRIDGRTKCSWIAETFGISRRSVTTARARLIDLGWITPLETPQWQLNKWGQRYQLNPQSYAGKAKQTQNKDTFNPNAMNQRSIHADNDNKNTPISTNQQTKPHTTQPNPQETQFKTPNQDHKFATPTTPIGPKPASPCLNNKTLSTKDLKNKKPDPKRSGSYGISKEIKMGSREKNTLVNLNQIQPVDLRETWRMIELYEQAIEKGLSSSSEAGQLRFLALAERAKAHGNNPQKLFAWLLKKQKFEYITQADEDAASVRIRAIKNGKRSTETSGGNGRGGGKTHHNPKNKQTSSPQRTKNS